MFRTGLRKSRIFDHRRPGNSWCIANIHRLNVRVVLVLLFLLFSSFNLTRRMIAPDQNQNQEPPPIQRVQDQKPHDKTQDQLVLLSSYRVPPPREGGNINDPIDATLLTSSTKPPFRIFAYAKSVDKYLTQKFLRGEEYEPEMGAFIRKLFPTNNNNNSYIAVDLGANIGFHSLHIASLGGHVISFEASPDTALLLQGSASINGFLVDDHDHHRRHVATTGSSSGSITLIAKGVSDTKSVGRLARHPDSPAMSSFAEQPSLGLERKKEGEDNSIINADVELVRAKDVLQDLGIIAINDNNNNKSNMNDRLRLLKVDVEGYELHALKGLDLDTYPFHYLTLEFFPVLLESCGTDPVELLVFIWTKGYRFLDFDLSSSNKINGSDDDDDKWESFLEMGNGVEDVRQWADRLTKKKNEYKTFHVNLYAKLVR